MVASITGFPLGPYVLLAPIGAGGMGQDELLLRNRRGPWIALLSETR
jgi:hypothetical protein